MRTVAVLLSTYNGEKYLEELIESILKQEKVNVKLLIRDDESSDSTVSIINKYKNENIKIIQGKNIGPQKSFLELIKVSEKADYYAYCDQDDLWYTDKLYSAIERIEKETEDEPALYMSSYEVVDSELNHMYDYDMHFEKKLRLEETLVFRAPSGCTMVFNEKLRDILKRTNPYYIRMHDFWTLMVAEAVNAKIITDDVPRIKYRQHGNNTVAINATIAVRAKRLLRSAIEGNNERWQQAQSLYLEKDNIPMTEKSIETLKKVVCYRNGIMNRFKLAFDPQFKTYKKYINILFKTAVLLGIF